MPHILKDGICTGCLIDFSKVPDGITFYEKPVNPPKKETMGKIHQVNPACFHIDTCAQLETKPCPVGKSLHGEAKNQHWWSGFPGAYCLKCGAEDKDEICLGNGCECPCHDEFWKAYEEACKEHGLQDPLKEFE